MSTVASSPSARSASTTTTSALSTTRALRASRRSHQVPPRRTAHPRDRTRRQTAQEGALHRSRQPKRRRDAARLLRAPQQQQPTPRRRAAQALRLQPRQGVPSLARAASARHTRTAFLNGGPIMLRILREQPLPPASGASALSAFPFRRRTTLVLVAANAPPLPATSCGSPARSSPARSRCRSSTSSACARASASSASSCRAFRNRPNARRYSWCWVRSTKSVGPRPSIDLAGSPCLAARCSPALASSAPSAGRQDDVLHVSLRRTVPGLPPRRRAASHRRPGPRGQRRLLLRRSARSSASTAARTTTSSSASIALPLQPALRP